MPPLDLHVIMRRAVRVVNRGDIAAGSVAGRSITARGEPYAPQSGTPVASYRSRTDPLRAIVLTMTKPRIALIHATPVAIEPIRDAFAHGWPQAQITNMLDDSLSTDLAAQGEISPRMVERFVTLARYAEGTGANAILFTCSAFGTAIEAARAAVNIPVLKPNEAMFDEALESGRSLGLMSTFAPSIPSMVRELQAEAKRRKAAISIRTHTVPDAMSALARGDGDTHDRLIAACSGEFAECDVLMLAQFSMARAAGVYRTRPGQRLLTSPHSAVARLKRDLA